MLKIQRVFYLLAIVTVFCVKGCDPDYVKPDVLVEVHGEIYQDGQPVTGARVVFVPVPESVASSSLLSYGTTDAKGEFDLKLSDGQTGARAGRYRVFIHKSDFTVSEFADLVGAQATPESFQFKGEGSKVPNRQIQSYDDLRHQTTYQVIPGRGIQRPRFEVPATPPEK